MQNGFSMKEKLLWLTSHSQTKMNVFQKDIMQMVKLNLTSFGQQTKLTSYFRLKIVFNIFLLSYTKEFVNVEIITFAKPWQAEQQK